MLNTYQLRLSYKNKFRLKVLSFFFWTPCTCHIMVKHQGLCVEGAYETHFFTMTAAKKWKITASLLPVWNVSNLDKNDSLHNNGRQIILLHQKSHTDMRFQFRYFLQYVTVPPNFSERVDVLSECKTTYEVNGNSISIAVPSERLKNKSFFTL